MIAELKDEYIKMRDYLQTEYFLLDKMLSDEKFAQDHSSMKTKQKVISVLLKVLDKTINPPIINKPTRQTEELY
jgi:hypothetical protein